ncbi:hypothetical protein DFH28DRAFT_922403 [Melampsora americana]|nr:hypothetical protein DFH28DRAFT_922403 [Melampsora americana]
MPQQSVTTTSYPNPIPPPPTNIVYPDLEALDLGLYTFAANHGFHLSILDARPTFTHFVCVHGSNRHKSKTQSTPKTCRFKVTGRLQPDHVHWCLEISNDRSQHNHGPHTNPPIVRLPKRKKNKKTAIKPTSQSNTQTDAPSATTSSAFQTPASDQSVPTLNNRLDTAETPSGTTSSASYTYRLDTELANALHALPINTQQGLLKRFLRDCQIAKDVLSYDTFNSENPTSTAPHNPPSHPETADTTKLPTILSDQASPVLSTLNHSHTPSQTHNEQSNPTSPPSPSDIITPLITHHHNHTHEDNRSNSHLENDIAEIDRPQESKEDLISPRPEGNLDCPPEAKSTAEITNQDTISPRPEVKSTAGSTNEDTISPRLEAKSAAEKEDTLSPRADDTIDCPNLDCTVDAKSTLGLTNEDRFLSRPDDNTKDDQSSSPLSSLHESDLPMQQQPSSPTRPSRLKESRPYPKSPITTRSKRGLHIQNSNKPNTSTVKKHKTPHTSPAVSIPEEPFPPIPNLTPTSDHAAQRPPPLAHANQAIQLTSNCLFTFYSLIACPN